MFCVKQIYSAFLSAACLSDLPFLESHKTRTHGLIFIFVQNPYYLYNEDLKYELKMLILHYQKFTSPKEKRFDKSSLQNDCDILVLGFYSK